MSSAARASVLAVVACACRHAGTQLDEVGGTSEAETSESSTSSTSSPSTSSDADSSGPGSSESSSDSSEESGTLASEGEASEGETSGGGLELVTLTIPYGPDPAQTLDLVLPQPPARASLPIVVLAHGGLWQGGSKGALAQTCANLVLGSAGTLACATIDYRLSDALGGTCAGGPASYAEQLRDFAAAATTLQDQADAHGLARDALFVGGHSAGGHLALSLALRWPTLTATCDPLACPPPRGAIGIEGIYDIADWDAYDQAFWMGIFACATRKAFGDPPGSPNACLDADYDRPCWDIGSPTYLADHAAELGLSSDAATLLVHSPDDDWVDFDQALELAAALDQAFPDLPGFVAVDGSCGVGGHDAVLVDPALTSCMLAFVESGGTAIAP